MVAQLLQAEADATEAPQQRAALLFERAVLLHDRLGKPDEARALLEEARRLAPSYLPVLLYLETLAAREGRYAELAALYEAEAGQVSAPSLRLALLCSAAGLYADRLGDLDRARALYEEAHRADPRHPVPIEALSRLYAAAGEYEALLALLEESAAAAPTPEDAAVGLHHAARIAREHLGRSEDAVRLLEAARAKLPKDPTILRDLAAAYEIRQDYEALVGVLRALTEVTRERKLAGEIWLRLGSLLDEKLGREEEAAEAWREALRVIPGSLQALSALGKLYFRTQRWQDLIWTFEQELEATTDPKQRAARLFKIAEIQEQQLGDLEAADATLNRVLQEVPGYIPALSALTRLYESQGRWADLVALHERELEHTEDLEQRIFLLEEIGRVREEHLSDLTGAIEAYERILELSPGHLPTVRRLQRLYEQAERWHDLAGIIQREADLVDDQGRVVSLLHRSCEIIEERIGDRDAAIEAWSRLLTLQPTYLPALRALGKLYFQKGRWQDLAEMYRQELEVTTSEDTAVTLLLKLAELYEEKLLDEEKAIATYREILEQVPGAVVALDNLARLHGRRGEWDEVVAVLRRQAEVVSDPEEKARLFCDAAAMREFRNRRPDQAAELYREALSHKADHRPALSALARLYGAAGAWRELASVYERTLAAATPAARVEAYRHLAHLYLDRLGEPARAVQCLEAVLAEQPEDTVSMEALERLYTARNEHAKAAALRERLAAKVDVPAMAAALYTSAALTHEHLEDPPTPAAEDYRRAFELFPEDDLAGRRVEVVARGAGDIDALISLYEAQRARADGEDLRLEVAVRLGDLYREARGDLERAESAYREALEIDPNHLPAVLGLKEVCLAREKWDEVQRLIEREGEISRDPGRSVGLLFEAGLLKERQSQDLEGAEAIYRKVLQLEPLEPRAHARLASLLEAAQRYDDLASLLLDRARRLKQPKEQSEAFQAAARVLDAKVGDPARALAALEEAIAHYGTDPVALERAGELAFSLEDWARAARHYERRLELGGAPAELEKARLRLGILYQEHLDDPQRAAAYLQDVLSANPTHGEALRRLADLQEAASNWAGAAATLQRLAEITADPEAKIALLSELASIHLEHRNDPDAAVTVLESVRELDPYNVKAVEVLGRLYESRQEWPKVMETYEAFVGQLPEEEKLRAFPIRMKMAEIAAQILDDPGRAITEYRAALALDPGAIEARIAVAKLYEADENYWPAAVEEHRRILEIDPLRVESLHALYRLFYALKAYDKAFAVAAVLHFLKACDQTEGFFYSENRSLAPAESSEVLSEGEHDSLLLHPGARGPLSELMAIVGDELHKVYPPQLDRYQVGRSERITPKDGSPLRKLTDNLLENLGGGSYELYRTDKLAGVLEVVPGSPPAVIVSADMVRRHPVKEQRFLLGRLMERVHAKTGLVYSLDRPALAATVQACVQIHVPEFSGLAPENPDLVKRCQKSMSRRARKALEAPARAVAEAAGAVDLDRWITGVRRSSDRAGLLLSGDIEAGLKLLAVEDGVRTLPEDARGALAHAEGVKEAIRFVVSEDFFRLRQRLKLSVNA